MADLVGYSALSPIINPDNNILKAVYDTKFPAGVEPIKVSKLHCTLMYDERNKIPRSDVDIPPVIYHASVMGVAVLGCAVVLLISSNDIMARHFELEELGFNYSYDNYAPHMSVLYYKHEDPEVQAKKLEASRVLVQALLNEKKIPSELYFTDEVWKPCD
jgi:hypothetical protein